MWTLMILPLPAILLCTEISSSTGGPMENVCQEMLDADARYKANVNKCGDVLTICGGIPSASQLADLLVQLFL